MTVDLAQQLADAQAAYLDNADWQTTGSASKALAFVAACNKLILLVPSLSRQAGRFEIQFSIPELTKCRNEAQQFVAASSVAGEAVGYSFNNSR